MFAVSIDLNVKARGECASVLKDHGKLGGTRTAHSAPPVLYDPHCAWLRMSLSQDRVQYSHVQPVQQMHLPAMQRPLKHCASLLHLPPPNALVQTSIFGLKGDDRGVRSVAPFTKQPLQP